MNDNNNGNQQDDGSRSPFCAGCFKLHKQLVITSSDLGKMPDDQVTASICWQIPGALHVIRNRRNSDRFFCHFKTPKDAERLFARRATARLNRQPIGVSRQQYCQARLDFFHPNVRTPDAFRGQDPYTAAADVAANAEDSDAQLEQEDLWLAVRWRVGAWSWFLSILQHRHL
ncbi:hypothetical protein MBANPS3_012596 [Mucor bainieri]